MTTTSATRPGRGIRSGLAVAFAVLLPLLGAVMAPVLVVLALNWIVDPETLDHFASDHEAAFALVARTVVVAVACAAVLALGRQWRRLDRRDRIRLLGWWSYAVLSTGWLAWFLVWWLRGHLAYAA